jgi:hypothetical protein
VIGSCCDFVIGSCRVFLPPPHPPLTPFHTPLTLIVTLLQEYIKPVRVCVKCKKLCWKAEAIIAAINANDLAAMQVEFCRHHFWNSFLAPSSFSSLTRCLCIIERLIPFAALR